MNIHSSTNKTSMHIIVARNVRAEATRRELLQKDLAKILNKSRNSIRFRLSGKVEFQISELETLAEAMGIEVLDFFLENPSYASIPLKLQKS